MKFLSLVPFLGFTTALFPLNKRQSVNQMCSEMRMKTCGQTCIDFTDTCCPDQAGGCPSSFECQKGSNGKYGCCPKGQDCVGEGGATTRVAIIDETLTEGLEEPTDVPSGGNGDGSGNDEASTTILSTSDSSIPTVVPGEGDDGDEGTPDEPGADGGDEDEREEPTGGAGGDGGDEETSTVGVPGPSPTEDGGEESPSPAAGERIGFNIAAALGAVAAAVAFAI